jgi:uncharacterized membrane protein
MSESRAAGRGRGRPSFPGDRVGAGLVASAAVTAATLATAFGLLAVGVDDFWIVFVVGFGVVLPGVLGGVSYRWAETERSDETASAGDAATALETLRLRYARGELTDDEFDRRIEALAADDTVRVRQADRESRT